MNYQAIYEDRQLPEYSSLSPADFAELRNEKSITRLNYIKKKVVNNYVMTSGMESAMQKVVLMPYDDNTIDKVIPNTGGATVRLAAHSGLNFLVADTGDEVNPENTRTRQLIGLLWQSNVFTQAMVDGFWALFKTYHSEAETLYGSDITEADVLIADRLPTIETINALRTRAANAYNACVTALDEAEANGIATTWPEVVSVFEGIE